MQTLNTLSTPEEKLAGLCKKYAELVSSSSEVCSFGCKRLCYYVNDHKYFKAF